jgi:tRNA modification GTPase
VSELTMSLFAAVMTGKGTGAISTIQVFGKSAKSVLKKIFKPTCGKEGNLASGKILLGHIADGAESIDQVTIGCESPNSFAINCHGNPLIVANIMELLQKHGAKLLTADQLLTKILEQQKTLNTIEIEAKLTVAKAKTLEGTKIIASQIDSGLNKTANYWLQNINSISLDEIKTQANEVLKVSQSAKLLISGCTIVIAGPPNSGKSTLLNCLAGTQKAIVTDIEGTTRDWVSAQCRIGILAAELIDTAGLAETLSQEAINKAAQQKSLEILQTADLILFVLDNNQTAEKLDGKLLEHLSCKKILIVLNKSDLPAKLDANNLPLAEAVLVSAKFETGIDGLIQEIQEILGVTEPDLEQPIYFTDRQKSLLEQLTQVTSEKRAASILDRLLKGGLSRSQVSSYDRV